MILFAYGFGLLVRLILVYQAAGIDALWVEGTPLPIGTPDAGRYGFYAEAILEGKTFPFSADYLTGYLIAAVTYIFHADLNWIVYLLPIFIAPLITVPMILIGHELKLTRIGFLAALISVSELTFYSRSSAGYMDTDGINMLLLLSAILFMLLLIMHRRLIYALAAAMILIGFSAWYHSAAAINALLFISFFGTSILFYRKEKVVYYALLLLGCSILPLAPGYLFVLVLLLFAFLKIVDKLLSPSVKSLQLLFLAVVLIGALSFDFSHYYSRALTYFGKNDVLTFQGASETYTYTNALKDVAEVRGISLWKVLSPIELGTAYFVLAFIGIVCFMIAFPSMLLMSPLLVLGALSTFMGSRFAMFAAPALAFGIVYIFYLLRQSLVERFGPNRYALRAPYYLTTLTLLLMIYNLFNFNMTTFNNRYFFQDEAKALKTFSEQLEEDSLILSWWDFGWPLWYYTARNNTLVDNGEHGGPDLPVISKLLLSDSNLFVHNLALYVGAKKAQAQQRREPYVIPYIAQQENLYSLFRKLGTSLPLEKQSDDNVYIMLHLKMLSYLDIIDEHAQDYNDENTSRKNVHVFSPLFRPFSENYSLIEAYRFAFDSSDGTLHFGDNRSVPIKQVVLTEKGKAISGYAYENNASDVLILVNNIEALYVDEATMNSFLIQALLFDRYDHTLFEKVVQTNRMKIFKVKVPIESDKPTE